MPRRSPGRGFPQAFEGVFVFAHRLQGDDAERRALATQQLDLDVIDEELLAIGFANPRTRCRARRSAACS
jgi:hypothetical protein